MFGNMNQSKSFALFLLVACLTNPTSAFNSNIPTTTQRTLTTHQFKSQEQDSCTVRSNDSLVLHAHNKDESEMEDKRPWNMMDVAMRSLFFSVGLTVASWAPLGVGGSSMITPPAFASDSAAIVKCLFQKCQIPLAKCVLNPKCLANVVCINTCNGREDEIGCQIQCGDFFENEVVGEFNKCVVSDMKCVPKQGDDGSYPVPKREQVVEKFDTKFFNEKLYITAGQNKLFDIFPCQVHFFTETEPGKFYGKLNWRIEEPDGEFFTRDALQRFIQDPENPAHLVNHDNEYLHYEDDWWIIDYEYQNNPDNIPPFAFVYYRGNNDAWEGYGGAVIYTPAKQLPEELIPRLREAAKKVNMDWDKEFVITDNSCPVAPSAGESLVMREKFAGKVILQTEQQVQAAATRFRGNAANSILAQKIFFEGEDKAAGKAFQDLQEDVKEFEASQKAAAALQGTK